MKKNIWILVAILFFAAILRLWRLGSIPPGLTQDEAALGYNAYSILKTGRDEYGKFLPVIFKSFGDYKPGLYIYLDVPFVAALGLNEVSTRLPSALAGVLSVFLIYLICKKLFDERLGLLAAFVAALNPWLIYFSRGAWEVNVALTLTLAGIYFFLRSFIKPKLIFWSSLLFALSLLTYQGAKLASAIVILILVVVYWKDLLKVGKKYLIGSVVLGVVISLPIIFSLFNGQVGRLDVFSIFSYPRPRDYTQQFLDEGGEKIGDLSYYLFHSETLNFARGILGRYFNQFSARFLFFEGDYQNLQHSAPYQGMFLISDIFLMVVGAVVLVRRRISKETLFILFWTLLGPLPAVLTRDQVQSVRALNMTIPLVVIVAFGLSFMSEWLSKRVSSKLNVLIITIFYIPATLYFLDAYFVHVPAHNSQYWNYGYKQVVEFMTPIQNKYKTIKVEQSFAQPYIYFLYYQKYDPARYQKQANLTQSANVSDVGLVAKLDNIEFIQINWSVDKNDRDTLLIGDSVTLPDDVGLLDTINYLDGRTIAFKIIERK